MKKNTKRNGPLKYFLTQLFQEGLLVIRGLIIPNLLGPLQYGIVSTLVIIERYSNFTNLGIHQNILYKVPLYRAKNNHAAMEEVKNISYSFTVFSGLVVMVGIVLFAVFNYSRLSSFFYWGIIIMSFSPFLLTVRGVYMLLLRADKDFSLISRVLLLSAVLFFITAVSLGILFGALGVLSAQIITSIVAIIYLSRVSGYSFTFQLPFNKLMSLLKFSIPIVFIIETLKAALATIDKIMVLKHLGVIKVGFYSVGLSLSSLVFLIPASIATVANPTLVEEYGRSEKAAADYFVNITYFITIVTAFFVTCLSLLAPLVIKIVFPKYISGIPSAQILPFIVYFEGLSLIGAQILILCNQKKYYMLFLVCSLIASYFALDRTFFNRDLMSVSIFMAVINAVKGMAILIMASLLIIRNRQKTLAFLGFIVLLSVCIVMYLWACENLWSFDIGKSNMALAGVTFIKMLVFSVLYILIFLFFFKDQMAFVKRNVRAFLKSIKEKFIINTAVELED